MGFRERFHQERQSYTAFLVLLFVFLAVYFLVRSVFVVSARYDILEKTLAVVFLLCEAFVLVQALGYFITVYRCRQKRCVLPAVQAVPHIPSVAILVPARHEPTGVLEDTLVCLYNLQYPNKHIYLLDDSSIPKFKEEAARLARKYEAKVFSRDVRRGAKAGIINDCVATLDEKYIAIFDADQNPIASFLDKLVPFLEADDRLGFIQTPQFYSNTASSRVALAANVQQAVFYEYICEGKGSNEAMVCCGTNVVLRRQALLEVGGLDEATVTEDFATSVKLHLRGWRSLYSNHVYVFGQGPEDLVAYLKQQHRWAMGNVAVLRRIIVEFFRNPFRLSLAQWFEYFVTGSYYLIGWAYIFLIFCPVLYIFFGIPSFFMNSVVYSLSFVPYLILSLAIFYYSMYERAYDMRQAILGQLLVFVTLPVYLRASLFGLLGVKGRFEVTAKNGGRRIPYVYLWPQLFFWGVNLAALTWALNKLVYARSAAILLNAAWIAYHFLLFSSIFYFNEEKV
ncbi:MAG: glycosyltransferase [Candidatus Omnitrophica bacterium]|nr:glycosyltransferase [Candidatus Omnitrophota bacterium]